MRQVSPEARAHANDFRNGYHHYRQRWINSEQQRGLKSALEKAKIPFVNKIVAFGTGSPLTGKTFVYDAVVSSSIFQIYMEYALPAAVMTSHLDGMAAYDALQDHDKYVLLKDPSLKIAGVKEFLWPRPLRPYALPSNFPRPCLNELTQAGTPERAPRRQPTAA